MKKHLLISFIAFNLLLSQANAFTPEEFEQAQKSLNEPYRHMMYVPVFTQSQIEEEAQRLHDVAVRKSQEQKMRDLKIQKERAINYLYLRTDCSKEDAIAQVEAEDFDVFKFNAECEAEEARELAEIEAERAVEQERLEAERAAEEAEWVAEEARWEAARAEGAARLETERAAEQVKKQKFDALMATGMFWLDALQYVSENTVLDVDTLLKKRNEEIAARQRIKALRQMLSEYDFDDYRIDVILNDSEFNPSDLSDLGREKLKVLNHLMHQDHSYKQAIDFVKASNFDAEGFFRAEEEKREAERAEWEAECAAEEAKEMRQAIETMRSKGLTVEEVNAVLADEDFDPYQYNRHERERLEDELWEKENARQEMLGVKFEEIYLQMKLKFSDENRARHISSEQLAYQFGSEEDRLGWFNFKKAQMPDDFNWQTYLSSYPDLLVAVDKIGSEEAKEKWAITHYFLHGQYEDRIKYKK